MVRALVFDAAIGRRVREQRLRQGLLAVEVASAIGVSRSAITELESGRATRQWVQLRRLAEVLGTTPNVILGVDTGKNLEEEARALRSENRKLRAALRGLGRS